MKLNKIQKDWILEAFFENYGYPGWKNIANKLIESGSCITTSQATNIWHGGIGNFINTKDFEEGEGVVEMTFDLDTFLNSKYFLECYNSKLNAVNLELKRQEEKTNAILNISEFILT
jgi:hypothetical protein